MKDVQRLKDAQLPTDTAFVITTGLFPSLDPSSMRVLRAPGVWRVRQSGELKQCSCVF